MKGLVVTVALLVFCGAALAGDRGAGIFADQCAACHGTAGLLMDTPILHGQEPAYLVKSLTAFKNGTRTDRIMMRMNAIAQDLSDDDMQAVASYLAGQDPCDLNITIDYRREGFKQAFVAGRERYKRSNCGHCHESFHHYAPRLIGQKAGFLSAALAEFSTGTRVAPMMANLLKDWTADDYSNVVTYLSGMRLMRSCAEDQ